MLLYKLSPTPEKLLKAVRSMFTSKIDELASEVTGAVFRHVKLETKMPRLANRNELKGFQSPTIVLAGEQDIFFPAHLVIPRAQEIIPNLVTAESIKGLGHLPTKDKLAEINDRILRFIND